MTDFDTPPANRTHLGRAMSDAIAPNSLFLQHCERCATVQYPPREVCQSCLSDQLVWCATDPAGTVMASTELHHTLNPWFQARSPWVMGSVKLDCGPLVLAHLDPRCVQSGTEVWVLSLRDASGQAALVAVSQVLALDQAGTYAQQLILDESRETE